MCCTPEDGALHTISPSRLALPALFTGAVVIPTPRPDPARPSAVIALTPIFVRLSDVRPAAKAFWRLFFALPILWAGVRISSKRRGAGGLPKSKRDHGLMATAAFYAGYLLSVKEPAEPVLHGRGRGRQRHGDLRGVLAVALAAGERLVPGSGRGWAVLVAMGIVSHVCGRDLIAYALAHLKAGFSPVGLLLQPVLATVLARALFHETLTPLQAAGGALVLAGIIAARRE